MKKIPLTAYAMLAVMLLFASGCAAPIIGAPTDERSFGTHISDSSIEASVKKELVSARASKIMDINVFSFYGDVYLIGEAEKDFIQEAVSLARGVSGVNSVTAYIFPPGSTSASDIVTETKINQSLLFAKGVPSSNVQVDVWSGQAILLGILNSQEEIDRVLEVVKGVSGVKSIKNYLMIKRD